MGEATTIQPTCNLRIYVACLAAYNNGHLHGAWIDATQDEWAMWDGIRAMLTASPVPDAEEYAIHDHEGFGTVWIGEYTEITAVAHIAAFLKEYGELGSAVLDYFGGDLDEAREALDDRYIGTYPSLADYMQDVTEDTIAIPDSLRDYIDWEAMARVAEMSGDLFTVTAAWNVVHVFAGC